MVNYLDNIPRMKKNKPHKSTLVKVSVLKMLTGFDRLQILRMKRSFPGFFVTDENGGKWYDISAIPEIFIKKTA